MPSNFLGSFLAELSPHEPYSPIAANIIKDQGKRAFSWYLSLFILFAEPQKEISTSISPLQRVGFPLSLKWVGNAYFYHESLKNTK